MNSKSTAGRLLAGNLLIFLSTLFWGLNVPVDKYLVPHWIDGAGLGVVRIVASTVLIWLTSIFLKMKPVDRSDWPRIIGGGVALFVFIIVFSISFKYTSPIDISIILTFPPMLVLLLRWAFQHLKVSKGEFIGMLVAFAGAVFLILMSASGDDREGSNRLVGDLLAFGSCIGYAVYLVLIEGPAKKYKPFNVTRWVQLFSSICCIPFLFHLPHNPVFSAQAPALPIILLALVVLLPSYAAYLFVPPAEKRIGSDLVASYQYLLPVIATIASIVAGLARFEWWQPVALVIILVGVYFANRSKLRHQTSSQTPRNI